MSLLVPACATSPMVTPADVDSGSPAHDAGGTPGHDSGSGVDTGSPVTHDAGSPAPHDAGTSQDSGGGVTTLAPYHVSGAQILDRNGKPYLFRGLNRPSLEWSCSGDMVETDYINMAHDWHANVVRIPLAQDCWIKDANNPSYDASYQAVVDEQVGWAKKYNMDVILDLHGSDKGDYAVGQACLAAYNNCQQDMADAHSVIFWDQVAAKYKNDPQVLFELYNEPHIGGYAPPASAWDLWLNGNGTSSGFTVHGMQELYTHVRNAGANNLVIIGGLSWSFDLSGISSHAVNGTNIIYNTHVYQQNPENQWYSLFGTFAATYPIIATEFGDHSGSCSTTVVTDFTRYANGNAAGSAMAPANKLSWAGWAYYATTPPKNPCTFPALINSDGTPSTMGLVVQSALIAGP